MLIHLIHGFPAAMAIDRRAGQPVLVVVNADEPGHRIRGIARVILPKAERVELACYLRRNRRHKQ